MAISKRIFRLFQADIHGLLDHLEDPEAIIRQAIREMEEDIALGEQCLQELDGQIERSDRTRERAEEQLGELNSQIDLCFDNNNESLARGFVKRRLETEARIKLIDAQRAKFGTERQSQLEKLNERRQKLEAIREKAEIFCQPKSKSSTESQEAFVGERIISDEQIEVEMLREKQRRATKTAPKAASAV